jgi:predicted RNase H-like nuclease (RuvC/YqgF family)
MAKAEPNLAEVNRLAYEPSSTPNTATRTIDVEHALAVLRSENARLKDCARVNAEREAGNEETRRKNYEGWRRENLRLQTELLASQEKVFELQAKLLSLREIVNGA